MIRTLGFAALIACAGCQSMNGPPAAAVNDGYQHLYKSGTFSCGAQPISVDGNHVDVTLEGSCRMVRVTGSHDDLVVYVPPNASIQVTGGHDNVVYRLIRAGAKPAWSNTGDSNDLVRNSRAPWQQDHDWYKEQH